ncbi:unnamed protein product [Calypogeia fissa]
MSQPNALSSLTSLPPPISPSESICNFPQNRHRDDHCTGRRRPEALLSPSLRDIDGVKSWEPRGNGEEGVHIPSSSAASVAARRLGTGRHSTATLSSSSVVGRIHLALMIPRGISRAPSSGRWVDTSAHPQECRWEGFNGHQKKMWLRRNGGVEVPKDGLNALGPRNLGGGGGHSQFLGDPLCLAWFPGSRANGRCKRCIAVHAEMGHDGTNHRERPRKHEVHGRRFRAGRPKPCGPYENIMLQGFDWESHKGVDGKTWWQVLKAQAEELCTLGITDVWLPPASESVDRQGYLPGELYNLDASKYGTGIQLKELIDELHTHGMSVIADIVINHRSGKLQDNKGHWNIFKGGNRDTRLDWGPWAVVDDDAYDSGGKGHHDTGESYAAAPDLDHTNKQVQYELTDWMNWMKAEIGFDGWRFDFVKGYAPEYSEFYCLRTNPTIAVGELWTSMAYYDGQLSWDQNGHRQQLCNWIDGTQGVCCAFDFTTKGILQRAVENEFWRLKDAQGKPPGLIGWWPEKAVTFLDNHDTGSTQRHWAFPDRKILQGYAYMLTHPGIPCIFYDHIYSYKLMDEIKKLLDLRKRHRINAVSKVNIQKAEGDIYVAKIDNRVILKLGPRYDMGSLLPGKDSWKLTLTGPDFAIWETTAPLPPLPAPPVPAEDVDESTTQHSRACPTQPVHITSKMSEQTRNRILREIPELVDNIDAVKTMDAATSKDATKHIDTTEKKPTR